MGNKNLPHSLMGNEEILSISLCLFPSPIALGKPLASRKKVNSRQGHDHSWSWRKAASCDHGINDLFWVGKRIPASSKHRAEKYRFFPHPQRGLSGTEAKQGAATGLRQEPSSSGTQTKLTAGARNVSLSLRTRRSSSGREAGGLEPSTSDPVSSVPAAALGNRTQLAHRCLEVGKL